MIFEHHDRISNYCQTSNISHTFVGNQIIDHPDVIGASPVGAAPTTSSFWLNTCLQWIGQRKLQHKTRIIYFLEMGATYIRGLTVHTC